MCFTFLQQQLKGLVDDVVGIATRVLPREFLAEVVNGQCVLPTACAAIIVVVLAGIARVHVLCSTMCTLTVVDVEPVRSLANLFDRIEGAV